jgi:hypothetical protein
MAAVFTLPAERVSKRDVCVLDVQVPPEDGNIASEHIVIGVPFSHSLRVVD